MRESKGEIVLVRNVNESLILKLCNFPANVSDQNLRCKLFVKITYSKNIQDYFLKTISCIVSSIDLTN